MNEEALAHWGAVAPKTNKQTNRRVFVVKGIVCVSDRMSYKVLRGCWYNIIVLNVHAPSDRKNDDSKDNFYDE